MKFEVKSDFAFLDVKKGRGKLRRELNKLGRLPKIPVTITGFVTGVTNHDDGTSQEFEVTVSTVVFTSVQEEVKEEVKEEVWTTQDGKTIAVDDMTEEHAKNALRMILRKSRGKMEKVIRFSKDGDGDEWLSHDDDFD